MKTEALQIARLLLAWGADPKAVDKKGSSAHSLVGTNNDLADILTQFDADGAMAFEDPPGSWRKTEVGADHEAPGSCLLFWYFLGS